MKRFLLLLLVILPFVFASCSKEDDDLDDETEEQEESVPEKKKPYSGWDYSEGYESWEGWGNVIEMTKEEFLNSRYMAYPETKYYGYKHYYNRRYCARTQSFTTYTGKKVERYTISEASKVDTILMNENSISKYGTTFTCHYFFDTDINMHSEENGFFMNDDWFNTVNVYDPGKFDYYNLSEHVSGGKIENLKHYGKTFYAVKYSTTIIDRVVIVEK
ncbi:MAG: hypothetical protein LBV72_03885 [Tannerella sp.]|jgi:hypothetical protein|nr:hypothetical protein [Tannerella sp.]